MPDVQRENRDQPSTKTTCTNPPLAIEEQVMGHRNTIYWKVSIGIESIISFLSELLGPLEKRSLMASIESLEPNFITSHHRAPRTTISTEPLRV
jgi:hypothetical protein